MGGPKIVKGFTYAEVWPLLSYSTYLHELMEDLADPSNWDELEGFTKGNIQELAQSAIEKASIRPSGPSTPVSWVRRACSEEHVWDELMYWANEEGCWKAMGSKRNNAGRPLCPSCGLPDSPKVARRLELARSR